MEQEPTNPDIELETRLRECTAELLHWERNFHSSVENCPLGIGIVTAAGETLYSNPSLLNMYGCSAVGELQKTAVSESYTAESYADTWNGKRSESRGCPALRVITEGRQAENAVWRHAGGRGAH